MYDVIAVDLKSNAVRLLAESKSERNAEAIVNMAVARRGCENDFFVAVPAGKYKNGDDYETT